jgi:hypothetical protein
MINVPNPKKTAIVAITLLIGGIATFIFLGFQRSDGAFDGFSSHGFEVDVPPVPSSGDIVDFGPADRVGQDSPSWPTLLIEEPEKKPASGAASASPSFPKSPSVSSPGNSVESKNVPQQWCDLASFGKADKEIVFNEIAWMGSAQSPNEEWLELKNISGAEVGAGGWQIVNRNERIKIELGATAAIAENNFLVLKRDKDYSGALSNTGDHLRLFDDECRLVDEVDATNGWPAGSNVTKQTLELDDDGIDWHSSVAPGGSPGKINSTPNNSSEEENEDDDDNGSDNDEEEEVVEEAESDVEVETNPTSSSTTTSSSTPTTTSTPEINHLVIAYVQITGGVGATDEDILKIHNPTSEEIDISGWKLRKRTKSGTESSIRVLVEGSVIPSGGHFTWANSSNGFSSTVNANASSTQTLSSDNSAALFTSDDILVDAIAWGSEHASPFIEGSAYPDNPEAGEALIRKAANGFIEDTNDNSNDFFLEPQDIHMIQ